jgi:riboflavin kinase/FMN adenylyltransferase
MAAVLHDLQELGALPGPTFLAIGVFDGVHLGHRAVIERALHDAGVASGQAVVVTFDPHPMRVLRPQSAPRLLTSTPHKIGLIEALGIEHILILQFTEEFAGTPPEKFIAELAQAARGLREICVGHEWSFGKNRAGDLRMLDRLGNQFGFEEVGVPAVKIDGEVVSSTLIRRAVVAGDLAKAERLLGRRFTVFGTVIGGDQIGRKLGFPTANLATHNEQFPPDGVYTARARLDGRVEHGLVNIGVRPTREETAHHRLLELHLLDFDEEIYGRDIEVEFLDFLRGERAFPNMDALREQIAADIAETRRRIAAQR